MTRILSRFTSRARALLALTLSMSVALLALPQVAHAATAHVALVAVVSISASTSALLLSLILTTVSAAAERTFEFVQNKWVWLGTAKPIVRYIASGLWGGLAAWLAIQIGHSVPADIGQFDLPSWASFLGSLVTWAWHSLVKSTQASLATS